MIVVVLRSSNKKMIKDYSTLLYNHAGHREDRLGWLPRKLFVQLRDSVDMCSGSQ